MPPAEAIVVPAPGARRVQQRRDMREVIGSGQAIGTANPLGRTTASVAVPLFEPWQ